MGSSVHTARGVLLLLLAGLCTAGCGRRTILEADADNVSDEARDGGPMLYACGRGKRPCDPENLGGKTCQSLGLGGGDLSCNPSTCNFDLKDCTVNGVRIGSGPASGGGNDGGVGRAGAGSAGMSGLFGTGAGSGAPSNTGGLFGTGAAGTSSGGNIFGGGNNTADAGAFFGGGFFGGAADGGLFGGGLFGGGGPNDAGRGPNDAGVD